MSLMQRYLAFVTRHFCKAEDTLDATRRQCLYVSIIAIVLLWAFFHCAQAFFFGTLWNTYSLQIWLVFLLAVALHCRISRGPGSHRLYYLFCVGTACYSAIYRGGFLYMPEVILLANAAPATALFVSPYRYEFIGWFLLEVAQMIVVYALQVHGLLPQNVFKIESIPLANFFHILHLAMTHLCWHWFVYHVYTMEKETRQTLQADLQLFTRLSHEIRTPITIISGMVELMSDWRLDRNQRRSLSDLSAATRRLAHVVHDILSFATSSSSTSSTSSTSSEGGEDSTIFNLRDVVDTVIGYHLPHAEASKLDIYIDIPSHLPVEVTGAKERLTCVLDQLIGNAIKFTPSGSVKIEVVGHPLPQAGVDEVHDFIFTVRDTGIGLTREELEKIFEPFTQSDGRPSRLYEGVGLGLTLANRMVRQWGKRSIQVESGGHGHGSAFTFSVPLRVDHLANPPTNLATMPNNPVNVLLVDDDRLSAKGVAQSCTALGMAVRHITLWEFSEVLCRPVDAVVFAIPNEPQPKIQESIRRSIEQLSVAHPHIAVVAIATSTMQIWCEDSLKLRHVLRKPPPFAHIKAALRSVALVRPSAGAGVLVTSAVSPRNLTQCNQFTSLDDINDDDCRPAENGGAVRNCPVRIPASRPSPLQVTPPGYLQSPRPAPDSPQPQTPSVPPTRAIPMSTSTDSALSSRTKLVFLKADASSSSIFLDASPSTLPPSSNETSSHPTGTPESSSSPSNSQPRILCVDDSPVILRLLTSFINKTGFKGIVDTALNGDEAIALAAQHSYLLVLMDFNMPGMTGAETTLKLRSEYQLRMPIVGITAAPNMRDVCLGSGMNEVIAKPFTQMTISDLVKTYIP